MAITVVGQGSAATTSVAIPTHQVGDMILVFTRGTAAAPTVPAASGTVPAWVTLQSALANAIGLTSVAFIATATNTTTGTFTNATHICVLVLRPGAGKVLDYGASAVGNGNNTQTIIYPALTLTRADGTSMGVRCGTRTVAITAVGTAPTSWTNQTIQPAGASALMSVHTRAALAANPVADTVSTTGTNAAYRAHTIEVEEVNPPTNWTVPLSDGLSLADGLGRGYGEAKADTLALADSFARTVAFARSPADAFALADAATPLFTPGIPIGFPRQIALAL